MEKLLSIIVPSYNMEAYLPKCLGSLLIDDKELFQALDVIVVNDGSKDRTSEIAHEFEAKYPGVFRVIDKSNGHYGSCVNAALKVAEGRFVKVLDADDYFETGAFEEYLGELRNLLGEKEIDVVFTDYSVLTNLSTRRCCQSFAVRCRFNIHDVISGASFVAMHSLTYRMELLRSINYRQTEGILYTDAEWAVLPMAYARMGYYVPICVYAYLIGREGQSVDINVQHKNHWMHFVIVRHLLALIQANRLPTRVFEFYRDAMYRLVAIPFIPFFFSCQMDEIDVGVGKLVDRVDNEFPELSCVINRIKIPMRSAFGFRYVYWWRRRRHLPNWIVFTLRHYPLLRRKLSILFH